MSTSTSRYRPSGRTEIARLRSDLEGLVVRIDEVERGSEVAADLHRYLCVRISGFLERALMSAARALCERESFARGQRFSLSWLERSPNPRADELLRLVRRFDSEWGDELESFLAENERASRINALLGIRNDIAHGRNQGVSRTGAWEYYELVSEVVDWLLDHFDPMPT